jgi:membrane fusion protein (multidrug efflux system)
MNSESTDQAKSSFQRRALSILGLVVLVVAGTIAARWFLHGRFHVETDDATVAGDIVAVTPQVSGTVEKILVEETMTVKAGDPLVQFDLTDMRINRERAEAEFVRTVREVRSLYAQTASLSADAASARAELEVANIDKAHAQADLSRRQTASTDGGVMGEELAHAEEASKSAAARVTAATRRSEAANQRYIAQAAMTTGVDANHHPRVLAAGSALRQAIINEGRATIRAPIAGQIARRAVTVGSLVGPGTPIMAIVPLSDVWVAANFKEGQLRNVRVGQPVELTADLYGSAVKYHGRVAGLDAGTGSAFALLPAQNATGNWIKVVQRVPVRVDLDAKELAEHPLRVGLSMLADVDTHPSDATASVVTPAPAFAGYEGLEAEADARIATLLQSVTSGDSHVAHPRHRGSNR